MLRARRLASRSNVRSNANPARYELCRARISCHSASLRRDSDEDIAALCSQQRHQ
jgi:hypothetical protein